MKFPKIIEKSILSSENVKEKLSEVKTEAKKELQQELKTQYNKEVSKTVKKALKSARKEWALDTAKALDRKFSKSRKYISTSGYGEKFLANTYQSGKNYNTLDTLFSDSPGSIQCASRIRDAVLGGGYVIKPSVDGKGTKKDLKHLIQFFDRPNPDDTIETLIGVCVENYLAYGNFYLEKVPTKKSANYKKKQMEVAELYNLDPTKMTILVDADKKKKGVLVKTGFKRKTDQNKAVIYNLDEILHTRRPHRKANLYGRAVLEDNTATLQLLLRAITYNINILRNGGRPPIQLILPEDSTEADADAVSAWFEKNYMGPHNAGKTLITFKGARAEALGLTLQDMSYLELLRYGLRLVSGQYGVPLPMIGFPEGTNRATMSEMRRSFYLTNVFPLRKLISQKLTKEIVQDGMGIEGWRLDFKTAGLEESEASRRDFMAAWGKGLYTFNECRISMGLLPIDEPWANKHYLLGTKNDSLIEVENAIGRVSETSSPDAPRGKPERKPGDQNPEEDETSHDEN